jgi:hypothetical protein
VEEHRLKPMPSNYDKEMFNRIYSKTEGLRKKLASSIDYRRFGLCYEDIVSAFNTKLLFTFTKYYGKPEGILKAHVINALQNYKNRIIKRAYIVKHSQTIISTELVPIEDHYESNEPRDYYYSKLMSFMRDHLSENAYTLLDIQLNPPPYILQRVNPGKDSKLQKIPDELLLEYFDLGSGEKAHKYLLQLKKEIRNAIHYAKLSLRV